jgi:hypothetical protein
MHATVVLYNEYVVGLPTIGIPYYLVLNYDISLYILAFCNNSLLDLLRD